MWLLEAHRKTVPVQAEQSEWCTRNQVSSLTFLYVGSVQDPNIVFSDAEYFTSVGCINLPSLTPRPLTKMA